MPTNNVIAWRFFSFFCLYRLMNCSDIHTAHVCSQCGGMISVYAHSGDYASSYGTAGTVLCAPVFLYFKLLANEALWLKDCQSVGGNLMLTFCYFIALSLTQALATRIKASRNALLARAPHTCSPCTYRMFSVIWPTSSLEWALNCHWSCQNKCKTVFAWVDFLIWPFASFALGELSNRLYKVGLFFGNCLKAFSCVMCKSKKRNYQGFILV